MAQQKKEERNYLGMPNDLLGYQTLPFLPYPETPLAYKNLAELRGNERLRQQAELEALYEAQAASERAIEDEAFARKFTIGNVVKPRNETLAGYQAMLKYSGKKWDVSFSPKAYGAFDEIIVRKSGVDSRGYSASPAFNASNPSYEDFAPLRRNIAILRNYLMCQMFEDGEFIPDVNSADGHEDAIRYQQLNQMADRLGEALASKSGDAPNFMSRWSNTAKNMLKGQALSTPDVSEFMLAANIPDKGALVMYNYLYGLKETPTYQDFYSKHTQQHWNIKPREESIFSDENMRLHSRSSRMQGAADAYEDVVMWQLRAPENLSVEDRNHSIEIARDILERLRKLMASSDDQEMRSRLTDTRLDETTKILKVADSFREALATIADADPEFRVTLARFTSGDASFSEASAIAMNPDLDPADRPNYNILRQAIGAFEQLGYRMKVETTNALNQEREPTAARQMQSEADKTPDKYKTQASTDDLLAQIEKGLREADRVQRQARLAARIAQREAQRAANRNHRQAAQSREDMAQAMRTARSSRSIPSARKVMEDAASKLNTGLNMDSMAGARVSEVNENAADYTRKVIEEHRQQQLQQAQQNNDSTTRSR